MLHSIEESDVHRLYSKKWAVDVLLRILFPPEETHLLTCGQHFVW